MFRLVLLAGWLLQFTNSPVFAQAEPAAAPVEEKPLVLPLVYRSPGAHALVVAEWPLEGEIMGKLLLENKIKVDRRTSIDLKQQDYSAYHLVVGLSNFMDGYGYEQNPPDFDPLERFVANGGHLLLFGTFNGRNSQNLQRFGISTGSSHSSGFRRIPGRSELLLSGFEKLVPANDKLVGAGNFEVSTPHVVLLRRAAQDAGPDSPALVTLAYKKGRVTFSQVEPGWVGDEWLITVLGTWAIRGGPTSMEQLNEKVVLTERELAARRKYPIPSAAEVQAAEQALREKLRDDIASAFTPEDKLTLATRLLQTSQAEASPAAAYAGLKLAQTFYLESSSPLKSFAAIREIQKLFQADASQIALETAKSLADKATDPVTAVEFIQICLDLTEEMIDTSHYDIAAAILELTKPPAQLAKNKRTQSLIAALNKRVGILQTESAKIQPFLETLQTAPDNPEANLEVGRFRCFVARDWEAGLPHLAAGSDVALRQLAEGELKGTDDPAAQAILADMWTAQSKKLPVAMRPAAQSRAKAWYWRAISKSSGSQKAALEKKADKIVTGKFELRVALPECDTSKLTLTRDKIDWTTKQTPPASVEVNDHYWPVATQGELPNRGSTRYLPEEVNLETVELDTKGVRGKVTLESVSPEELVLTVEARSDSEFILRFGR